MQHILAPATDTMTRGRLTHCRSSRLAADTAGPHIASDEVSESRRLMSSHELREVRDRLRCDFILTVPVRVLSLLSSP
jgi:hypothetical protein